MEFYSYLTRCYISVNGSILIKHVYFADGSHESVEDPIWICFLCAQQFVNQDELMIHQDQCEKETEEKEVKKPVCRPPSPPRRRNIRRQQPRYQPSHIVIQPKPIIFHPEPVKLICHRRRTFTLEPYIPPLKEDFLKALSLSDKPKEPPRVVTPVSDIDSDCEIIDVTYDETAVKMCRTPKSLMSQMSRDIENSARKRHLSFSQVLDLPEENSSDNSENESESGSQKKPKTPFGTLLCGIDLTSPLGQRVKKHWKIEANYSIVSEDRIEVYCSGPMKNDFVEKLRHRGESSYPIVFNKKNRKHMAKHKHQYKFNSGQRKEFMLRLKTGLSKRSRKLLSEVVKCKVLLKRLKPGVIRRWVRRKPPHPYPYAYIRRMFEQEHPIIKKIVQKPIAGPKYAKLKQISDGLRKLNRPHNLLPNQRMVTKMVQNADGTSSMRMVCAPPSSMMRPQYNNMGNNRRKQTFDQHNVRQMDPMEIEIIELSSSDEEEGTAQRHTAAPLQPRHTATPPQPRHTDTPPQPRHTATPPQPRHTDTPPQPIMTHYKNITGVPGNSSEQLQKMAFMANKQKPTNSIPQQLSVLNPSTIRLLPNHELQGPRSASPSNTRARIFQGVKGILSPSTVQNKAGVYLHSSPPGGSTCKEMMQNSKPVSGMVNRAVLKDSTAPILRNASNTPTKLLCRNAPKAANFPGYVNRDYSSLSCSDLGTQHSITEGPNRFPVLKRQTNGSPLPHKTISPKPTIAESKPRDPIMESDIIIIDDED